jgi:RHS repeat-associated protein
VNDTANGVHFAAYDGNGNVTALVKGADGTISAQYEYGPFAEPIRVTGAMGKINPIRFSTKCTDDESDFLYYGKRYYNPSTGRWPNRDPIEEQGGLNLYGFVYNNPVNFFDPTGQNPAAGGVIGGGIGTAVCPGIGTAIGVGVGIIVGGIVVWIAADAISDACNKPKEDKCEKPKKCLPCIPPVGSVAYRVDMPPSPPHNGIPTPHSHMYQMHQSPPSAGCVCFWVKVSKDPLPGILGPAITPARGGGVAP